MVVGIDEVGRGCVAGPVGVGLCVVYTPEGLVALRGIKDSKALTPKRREAWVARLLQAEAEGYIALHYTSRSAAVVDRRGIVSAIAEAITEGLSHLSVSGTTRILLDGSLRAPAQYVQQKTLIGGDAREPVIAAASVFAKVTRDREMASYDRIYFTYGFSTHKGYGTRRHFSAIQQHGFCPLHRRSFLRSLIRPRVRSN